MSEPTTQPMPLWAKLMLAAMGLFCVAIVAGVGLVVYLLMPAAGGGDPKNRARLAELVPDADARAMLSAYYGDWAAMLRTEAKPLKTTGQFRDAYRMATPALQQSGDLPSVKAIDEPISNRIAETIGLADTNLDGEPPLRSSLAATLSAISDDFGGR